MTHSATYKLTFVGSKAGVDNAQVTINVSNVSTGIFGPPTALNTTDVNGGLFSETQSLVLANSTGGTWRLAFNGEVTAPLSFNASASQVKTSLDALVSIDNVTVTGSAGSFVVTFGGTQASQNVSQIFGDAATASSGKTTRTISTTYNGSSEVLSLSDPSSTISYTRDNLGRATSISNTIAGRTPKVVLAHAFDSPSFA